MKRGPKKGYKQTEEHRLKRIAKGRLTRLKKYGNEFGPSAGWNKGLSKEDSRIKKSIKKATNTIKKQYENGRIVWNKGLTKDDNESLKRISENKLGVKRSQETKDRVREGVIRWRLKHNPHKFHFIGKNEKLLLDQQEIIDRCKIDRQVQVGKFVVDGYCPETNTVYEVYENHHKKRKNLDSFRQKEIQKKLKCLFKIIEDEK